MDEILYTVNLTELDALHLTIHQKLASKISE